MELIKIYRGNLVNARDLWGFLEVKTEFRHWIKRMLDYGFEEGKDFRSFLTETSQKGGRPSKEYYLTIGVAKEISMVQRTEKGREARRYFIKCEETLIEITKNKRLEAYLKLQATKKRLLKNIENIGGTKDDFIQIDYEGRRVLFNGEPLEDEKLHLVLLKGRDFATEVTNVNFEEDYNLETIKDINKTSHNEVRQTIINNTKKKPEQINPDQDIKELGE